MSFENLVSEHGRQVLGAAMRVLCDASLAHDVHQEVFLAVWRRWDRYNGNVNWPAYLYRATIRKALEIARSRARSTGILPVSSVGVSSLHGHGQDARGTHGRDGRATETSCGVTTSGPDCALQADELQQKLAAALAKLPRRQAEAFILSRLEKR
ncbi:MAG TPA: sigma-70 family RNA polymerase sigma factor [Sedimentisphaerales bacterium]|jgi:RNA polymerase sigma factor (sigma-70 family)|nr:sigma-70 family RNA polymerase sigma factor [Sedimentisphaerales bacterium]HNU29306.1 sigma-70 family RNA polymerase sigma factor [Sedimentisphaerales bacterium]